MYCFVIFFHLISSVLHTRSFFVPFAYVSIESIDCILSSSLVLSGTLLTFPVNTSYLLLLNICCDFNINVLFFMNSLRFPLCASTLFFYLFFFYVQVGLHLNNVYNLQNYIFCFMKHFFIPFDFCFLLYHLLNSYVCSPYFCFILSYQSSNVNILLISNFDRPK